MEITKKNIIKTLLKTVLVLMMSLLISILSSKMGFIIATSINYIAASISFYGILNTIESYRMFKYIEKQKG